MKLQEGKLYKMSKVGGEGSLLRSLLSNLVLMYVGPSHKEPKARVLLLHKDGVADVDKDIADYLLPLL